MALFAALKKRPSTKIHIIAILTFIIVSIAYTLLFYQNQPSAYRPDDTLWDSAMFSGVPQYSHAPIHICNAFTIIIYSLSSPLIITFLTLLGIYLFQNALNITPKSAIIGSIIYALFTSNIATLNQADYSQAISISLIAFTITATAYIFDRRKIIGSIILLISLALQTATAQYQILYYTLLIAITFIIYKIITQENKKQNLPHIAISLAITLIITTISIATNAENILPQYEYSQYSVPRTPNQSLAQPTINDQGEALSIIIPDVKGGNSRNIFSENSQTYKLLQPLFGDSNAKILAENSPMYFGKQSYSELPSYIGVLAILLALISAISARPKIKWWLIAITIISLTLSCGNIQYFIARNLPLFYTYTSPADIIIIATFAIAILSAVAIDQITLPAENPADTKRLNIAFYISSIAIIALLLTFIIKPDIAGIYNPDPQYNAESQMVEKLTAYMPNEPEYAQAVSQFKNDYIQAVHSDRATLIRHSATSSLIIAILGILIIYMACNPRKLRIPPTAAITAIALIIIIDNILVSNNYIGKHTDEKNTPQNILTDDTRDFRVIDIAQGETIYDNYTHKRGFNTLGGITNYPQRYQTLCDSLIQKEVTLARYYILTWADRNGMTIDEIQQTFSEKYKTPYLDLLNVKQLILSQNTTLTNTHALGNAWFPDSICWATNEQHELSLMRTTNTNHTAIVNRKYENHFTDINFQPNPTDQIIQTAQKRDTITYLSTSSGNRLALFSEMYYPKGWRATIDGNPATHFRADYALRALIIPAGQHEIRFVFSPKSVEIGTTISRILNYLTLLIIITLISIKLYKRHTLRRLPKILNSAFLIKKI